MEPLIETKNAIRELSVYSDHDLGVELAAMATRSRELVPQIVGVSLGLVEEGLTFTFVATDEVAAALDAVQYLDGGPCVHAAEINQDVEVVEADLLDEGRWLLFAQAGAAAGVASTLSIPILHDGRATGGVNIYASSPRAFEGHHAELAELFSAWAPGAVTNADLSFSTRLKATQAPRQLDDQAQIDQAVGMVIAAHGVDTATAKQRLQAAAAQAGVTEALLARTVLETRQL